MSLTLLLGGARSGKSALAERWAAEHARAGGGVVVVATGEPFDDEMRDRIARHRADRPDGWVTVEQPLEIARAVAAAEPDAFVVVDCVTTWLANMTFHGRGPDVSAEAARLVGAARRRPGRTVVVSNEVGSGIVPADPDTRQYRDELGRLNQQLAAAADEALLLVAGRILRLEAP